MIDCAYTLFYFANWLDLASIPISYGLKLFIDEFFIEGFYDELLAEHPQTQPGRPHAADAMFPAWVISTDHADWYIKDGR